MGVETLIKSEAFLQTPREGLVVRRDLCLFHRDENLPGRLHLCDMDKTTQKKLVAQIKRLCEKQYRKGFQQGAEFYAAGKITLEQVSDYRHKGSVDGYRKCIDPLTGKPDYADRLKTEIMGDMEELDFFLSGLDVG
jgi:hypothetical protein